MIYADSSVIVKRYYKEPGTRCVCESFARSERVFTSKVAYAEVHAALARKRREGGISPAGFEAASGAFEAEWPSYDHILVDAFTMADVRRLVRRHALRVFDAIHLAAAVWLGRECGGRIYFWVSDARLEVAARKEHLAVFDPERRD